MTDAVVRYSSRAMSLKDDSELHGNVYLWRYPGQLMDHRMKEVHLFIPTDDFELPAKQGKNATNPVILM